MKLNGYQCDRCGSYYEKNETLDCGKKAIGIAITRLDGTIRRYDLCDDCLTDVLDLLGHPEIAICVSEVEKEQ